MNEARPPFPQVCAPASSIFVAHSSTDFPFQFPGGDALKLPPRNSHEVEQRALLLQQEVQPSAAAWLLFPRALGFTLLQLVEQFDLPEDAADDSLE
jgi:hypothetical protein